MTPSHPEPWAVALAYRFFCGRAVAAHALVDAFIANVLLETSREPFVVWTGPMVPYRCRRD